MSLLVVVVVVAVVAVAVVAVVVGCVVAVVAVVVVVACRCSCVIFFVLIGHPRWCWWQVLWVFSEGLKI